MDEELIEDVRKVLKHFSDAAEEGAVVLVEGPRDIEALRMLGFTGTILSLSHLDDWVKANPPPRKIILLMDFDREGVEIVRRLEKRLTAQGYRVDTAGHKRLMALKRVGITTVEAMKNLAGLQQRGE